MSIGDRVNRSVHLLATLSVAIVAALMPVPASAQSAGLALDRSRLPPLVRLNLGQVASDTTACLDFNRFTNQPWLDANPAAAATPTRSSNMRQLEQLLPSLGWSR